MSVGVCEHRGDGAFQSPYQFSKFKQAPGNPGFGDLWSHFCRSREPLPPPPPPCPPACCPADLHQPQIILPRPCCASLILCTASSKTAWNFLPFTNEDKANDRAQHSQVSVNELRVEIWVSCLFTKSLMNKEPDEPGSDDQPVAGSQEMCWS